MRTRLGRLYGKERAEQLSDRLYMLIGRYGVSPQHGITEGEARKIRWSHKDAVLIAYGDMVQNGGEKPLQVLKRFCDRRLRGAINTVHILPFFPSSADGGFSVIDYRQVDSELGSWDDVEQIARDYGLMLDLVLNHCSRKSAWFRDYVNGIAPGIDYFQEGDPDADLSAVVRPRPWPLLSPTETSRGTRHVWNTFSEDQVDLNWKSPDVLFEFLDLLLNYVSRGARIVRLDAVAFLWKTPGTGCVHLPETHEVVKLMRDVLTTVAPQVILLTETNVPHFENVSYFGRGDEAHMIYQFALPPLILHGLLKGDSYPIQRWARSMKEPPKGCSFLNFTASHDGIGVRPIEGWVPPEEVDWLVNEVEKRDGLVSFRTLQDGTKKVYELNITYRDALSIPGDTDLGLRRYLCSQALMLSLRGVPAVYFHSLVGGKNWREGPCAEGGENRDINRRRWDFGELEAVLDDPDGEHAWIMNVYAAMLRARANCAAFHPDAPQEVLDTAGEVLALLRTSLDGRVRVLCCFNFTVNPVSMPRTVLENSLGEAVDYRNLLSGRKLTFEDAQQELGPFESEWVVVSRE